MSPRRRGEPVGKGEDPERRNSAPVPSPVVHGRWERSAEVSAIDIVFQRCRNYRAFATGRGNLGRNQSIGTELGDIDTRAIRQHTSYGQARIMGNLRNAGDSRRACRNEKPDNRRHRCLNPAAVAAIHSRRGRLGLCREHCSRYRNTTWSEVLSRFSPLDPRGFPPAL